jgi:predicted secreted protein
MSPGAVPEVLTLRVGREHRIHLPSLGTAGYVWTAQVDGDSVEVSHSRGSGHASAPGASSEEIIVIRPLAEGSVTIRLEQRRPWELLDDPHDSATVRVTVLPEN